MSGPVCGGGCHVCGASAVEKLPGYGGRRRVTSDCKPWPAGGKLCVCRACGCVQKVIDREWLAEVERIYDAYSIYYQSGGLEQVVFETGSGRASPRSARLLEHLRPHLRLPESGRLLDVGCGNGAFLRAFSRFAPRWTLAGSDLSDKCRQVVQQIAGFEELYTTGPDQIPGVFDLITMVHMLEHVPGPGDLLVKLKDRLAPQGFLVIQLPDYSQNPFDLLVADHSTHFTVATAEALVQDAGYEVLVAAADWIPKELTVVARKNEDQQGRAGEGADPRDAVAKALQWLERVVQDARQCAGRGDFGIFGTSIAATWLFSEVGGEANFFVDEDPHRMGKSFMGRPIYHPTAAPDGSQVFVALPGKLAESVGRRITRPGVTVHFPPVLPA